MGVRLIAGRAGSGKTHGCLSQIRDRLAESLVEGPRLVLLVPEQAALQMERALLAMTGARVLGRCDVLSFRRLAHRILNDSPGPMPTPLTVYGRQMALRFLIGRRPRELREFAKVAERGGFLRAIADSIAELFQEAVSIDRLDQAASQATRDGHPSAPRLADLALLYRAYLDYLGSQRVDPEGVLDLARARLSSAEWLSGAQLWLDGFAGLTRQQLRMLVALAQRADRLELALLMDPADHGRKPDELSLFARTEQTWASVVAALRDANVAFEAPLYLGQAGCPRFRRAPALAQLEKNLFMAEADSGRPQLVAVEPHSSRPLAAASRGHSLHATVRLAEAPDRRAEVAAAARQVLDLVQSPTSPMRYRDIAIVVRDLEPYHDLVSAELTAHGIPFFVDRRRPTFHHPLIQAVRALVAMHGDARLDQSVGMLLKTGLSPLEDDAADAMENYVLAHGISASAAWKSPWTYAPPGFESAEKLPSPALQRLRAINASRDRLHEALGDWWPSDSIRKSRLACRKWVEGLCAMLDRLETRRRLQMWCADAAGRGDLDEVEEHQRVWADLMTLLDEMVAALGEETMTPRQFRDCLESGLSQLTLGLVPATLDQVLVSSIERSRHPPVQAVFVLGFHDGLFPARIGEDNILSDEDRTCLEAGGVDLPRTRRRRLLEERMLAYVAFTRPSRFLWVSYPSSDERGRPLEPSPYWESLCVALPEVEVQHINSGEPDAAGTVGALAAQIAEWAGSRARTTPSVVETQSSSVPALYEWARGQPSLKPMLASVLASLREAPPATLLPASAAALWRQPYCTSVTALEEYAWCPFKHYASRGLGLERRAVHEIAAVDMGLLYHGVLEQFVNEMVEAGRTLSDFSAEEIAVNVDRLCKIAVPKFAERMRMEESEKRRTYWRGRQELRPALRGLQKTLGRTKLHPLMSEKKFGLPGHGALPALELPIGEDQTVTIRGRIDRVDVVRGPDGWIGFVFDYKRRLKNRLRLDQVHHGLALQLLTYLLVLQEHARAGDGSTVIPGGAFYLPLLGELDRVEAASEADDPAFSAWRAFKPRGIIDFDALVAVDPESKHGWNESFSVFKTDKGKLGYAATSDAVAREHLPLILSHVRAKLTELAKQWIAGDISVSPAKAGKELPCTHCEFRGVCRFEYSLKQMRDLPRMSQSAALLKICGQGPSHA